MDTHQTRRLSILAILFLLSTAVLTAQIKIKERVEIAPKATTSKTLTSNNDNDYTQSLQLDYPAEVTCLDLGYWASLDYTTISPGSTRCGTLPGYPVRHLFWIVSCNGRIVRCNDSQCDDDNLPGEYADYGGTFGIFYGGELRFYPCGKDVDDIIKVGSTPYYIGNGPWGGIYLFEKIMHEDGSWEYHCMSAFNISITRLTFCPPVAISLNGVQSIMYMDAKEMQIGLQDDCGKTTQGLGPTPMKYYVKITSGKKWGYVYNPATGQYGDSIKCTASNCDTSFIFLAMNQQPNQDQQVMLRVWSDDTSFIPATREITVQSAKCMLLSVAKPHIGPGEKDSIIMMQNFDNGASRPYPPDQTFNIRLDTSSGRYYGTLHCLATGDTGQVLNGLLQPFEFVAADSINVDSAVVVEIDANAQVVQSGPCSIGIIGIKDTLRTHTSVMASTQTKIGKIAPAPNEINKKNIESSIKMMQSLLDEVVVKKDYAKQKQGLTSGIKKLKAQLAVYTASVNPAKEQSSLINAKKTSLSFSGETGCTGKTLVTIGMALTIVDHSPWTIWPYLPPQNNTPHNRGADRPGYNPKRTFTIKLLKGDGTPYPNQQISIFTKYEKGSGGHGHTGWADTAAGAPRAVKALPQDTLQGIFYYNGDTKGKNPLTVTTDAKGEAKIDSFIASQASGKFLVTARMVNDTTIMDTVNLQVKVDGLVNFGIGSYWTLTGNTSKVGINHTSNHWCTQKMKDSLEVVLKEFYIGQKLKQVEVSLLTLVLTICVCNGAVHLIFPVYGILVTNIHFIGLG